MRRRALLSMPFVLATGAGLLRSEKGSNQESAGGDPPYLLEAGWTPLIHPGTLDGWNYEHPEKGKWTSARGIRWDSTRDPKELTAVGGPGDRLVNGPHGGSSNIFTTRKFADIELYLEFLIPAKSNSGIYLHGLYEVQVFDSFGVAHPKYSDCGGIYERWINNKGEGGTPPAVNACRRPGQWQSFQIWFRAPRFDGSGKKISNATFLRVLLNGQSVQANVEAPGPTRSGLEIAEALANPLMLQGDHGPVAYRNIYWRPLQA